MLKFNPQHLEISQAALDSGKIVNNILPRTLETLTIIENALIEAKDCNEKFLFLVMG